MWNCTISSMLLSKLLNWILIWCTGQHALFIVRASHFSSRTAKEIMQFAANSRSRGFSISPASLLIWIWSLDNFTRGPRIYSFSWVVVCPIYGHSILYILSYIRNLKCCMCSSVSIKTILNRFVLGSFMLTGRKHWKKSALMSCQMKSCRKG